MNSHAVLAAIEEIAATSSRNDKETLVERYIADPLFKRVLQLAYDTFITFGITPPKVKKFGHLTLDKDSVGVWDGLDQLATRKLTGNAAKAWVKEVLETFDQPSSQLLCRILSKDLKAGFGKNTVNRVMPGTIVTFDVMLSKEYEAKRIKAWPVAIEPKLDGLRAMSLVQDHASKAFSRVGNHFPALDCMSDPMSKLIERAHHEAYILSQQTPVIAGAPPSQYAVFWRMLGGANGPTAGVDAESLAGGFAESSGSTRRKSVQADKAVLNVFDCVPYALLIGDEPIIKIPYKVRRALVEFIVSMAPEGTPIRTTPVEYANSDEEVMEIFHRWRRTPVATYIANGDAELEAELLTLIRDPVTGGPQMIEGAMVKPLDSLYVKKKTHAWMKIKAQETEDLRIVGWFEGDAGGRLDGVFAGYLVEREFKGEMVEVAVGGGFKHAELQSFGLLALGTPSHPPVVVRGQTRHRFTAPGRLLEVEYHEVTPDGSLRHPRFVRFRDDKDELLKAAA